MTKHKKSRSKHGNVQKNTSDDYQTDSNQGNDVNCIYKIKESEILGRYLVASKKLNAGDIVMTDDPIVVGPCQEAEPLCIGCYANIDLKDPKSYHRCKTCSWPLCALNCTGNQQKYGHSKEECELLSKSLIKDKDITAFKDFYYTITPFRCLLMKDNNPELWKVLQIMESHDEKRRQQTHLWETNQKLSVSIIRGTWGLTQFTEEEIHFICGVLEVNAFEVNLPTPGAQCLRAVYPNAYLFAHDCIPNTCHSNGEEFQLIIRSTRCILPNDTITVSYAYTLQSTLKRRKHLRDTKFFSCCCKRCSDPTELGTYAGAMKCPTCKTGFVLPKNPLNDDSVWLCTTSKCKYKTEPSKIISVLDGLFKELDSIRGNDISGYEKFLEKCYESFHENHYLCLSAMHCLSQLYGKISGYLINDLTEEQLERKEEICRNLIRIFEKLEPGLSKQKGILLYELQAPLMVKLRRRFESQVLPKKEMKSKIKEVLKCLEESHKILSREPENSTEYQMSLAAKDAIHSLQGWGNLLS